MSEESDTRDLITIVSQFCMATYAYAFYKLRIIGHNGASATDTKDKWSTGFNLAHPGKDVPTTGDYTAFLESISGSIAAFHAQASSAVGQYTWLDDLTIARIGTNGKYNPTTAQTVHRLYSTPVAGGVSAIHPWNTAMVASLRTTFPRGIASNGRTYYPTTGIQVDGASGRVGTSPQTAWLTGMKNMINAINAAAGTSLDPNLRIAVVGASGLSGPARNGYVDRVRCDNRVDSIERRENDQPSAWVEQTLA